MWEGPYVLARLRQVEDELRSLADGFDGLGIGGSPAYQQGYASGRSVAYEKAWALVSRLRREAAAAESREAR